MPDGGAHPLHLAFSTLVEHELERSCGKESCAGRSGESVFELDALAQAMKVSRIGNPVDIDLVHLLDAVPGVGQVVRQFPVVREDKRSCRVDVEATDGHDAVPVAHGAHHGRAPLRVASGCDDTRLLVEEHVDERLGSKLAAVEGDQVILGDRGREAGSLSVDRHPPGPDQLVGLPARRDPGPGKVGVESHRVRAGDAGVLRWQPGIAPAAEVSYQPVRRIGSP